jgi:hypothetical protein
MAPNAFRRTYFKSRALFLFKIFSYKLTFKKITHECLKLRQSDCFGRGNKQTPSTIHSIPNSQISPRPDMWEQVVVRPTITNQT